MSPQGHIVLKMVAFGDRGVFLPAHLLSSLCSPSLQNVLNRCSVISQRMAVKLQWLLLLASPWPWPAFGHWWDWNCYTTHGNLTTPGMVCHEYARKVCWWCVVSHNVSVQWGVVQIFVLVKTLQKIAEPGMQTFSLPICDCLVEGIWRCIRLDNCIFSCLHKH